MSHLKYKQLDFTECLTCNIYVWMADLLPQLCISVLVWSSWGARFIATVGKKKMFIVVLTGSGDGNQETG